MLPFPTIDSEVTENDGGSTTIASESFAAWFDAVGAVALAKERVHVGSDR